MMGDVPTSGNPMDKGNGRPRDLRGRPLFML